MLRVPRCTVVAASITLVLAGCQDAAAPSHGSPALGATPTMSIQANPPFVLHQVPPASTDNNIDKWLSDHFVWLYPGAERGEKLFVHLPGGANPIQVPASFQFLAREAARLGYHVIVLTYPNQDRGIELLCGGNPACEENVRLDIIDGGDRSFPVVDVSRANSIDNRLTKLLERLTLDHPEEGWSQFLNDGEPNWSQIVLSGFSFGGSEAAMLAKLHRVNRVTLFAAPRDADATAGGQPPPWVALGETPSERYYGLVHQQDPLSALTLTSWREKLDMQQFGEAVFEDASMSAPPYGNTHMLVTNRRTRVGTDLNPYLNAHGSVATDQFTPLDAPTLDYPDGKPQLRDAWRYILGPDQEPPALTVPEDIAPRIAQLRLAVRVVEGRGVKRCELVSRNAPVRVQIWVQICSDARPPVGHEHVRVPIGRRAHARVLEHSFTELLHVQLLPPAGERERAEGILLVNQPVVAL